MRHFGHCAGSSRYPNSQCPKLTTWGAPNNPTLLSGEKIKNWGASLVGQSLHMYHAKQLKW